MNQRTASIGWPRVACAAALVCWAVAAQAQTAHRSVAITRQPAAPAAAATNGAPNAAGLSSSSSVGSPAGLTSQFPAGLPSTSPFPAGLPPVTTPNLSAGRPTAPVDSTATSSIQVPNTSVAGGPGVPASRMTPGAGGGGYTAQQIAASFLGADLNRDGELTRAEAQRLTIMPYSFEEMDANHDGVITRFEYEDGVR